MTESIWDSVPKYISTIIPEPKPDTNVLLLNVPLKTSLIYDILDLGVKIHIVEPSAEKCWGLIDEMKPSMFSESGTFFASECGKIVIQNSTFRNAEFDGTKFDSVFDLAYLVTLPHKDARIHFGGKVIMNTAETCYILSVITEQPGRDEPILPSFKVNESYGRNFVVKQLDQVPNKNGAVESIYTASKFIGGADFYDAKYSTGFDPWTLPMVNHMLVDFYHRVQPEGEPPRKIMIPMAGKTLDTKWLANKGHEVVVVEISIHACRKAMERDGTEYEEIDFPQIKGKLLKSKDGKIRMYVCDVFNFSKDVEGTFDSVWERGAVCAFEEDLRRKYFKHIQTMVASKGVYMSSVFQYDKEVYYNHPFPMSDDEVRSVFGEEFEIESPDAVHYSAEGRKSDRETEVNRNVMMKNGLKELTDRLYIYTRKY